LKILFNKPTDDISTSDEVLATQRRCYENRQLVLLNLES